MADSIRQIITFYTAYYSIENWYQIGSAQEHPELVL